MLLYTDDLHAARPIDEAALQALGIFRLEVPVPFLEAGGPVNVYALEDEGGGWTLFDCGVGTAEGQRALREGLHAAGVELGAVRRLIVSHGHVDHYGNAQLLAEASGAPVFVHPDDVEKVCGDGRWSQQLVKHLDFYRRLGVPAPMLDEMIGLSSNSTGFARQVDRARVQPLAEGQKFQFRHFEGEVLHMPGHTPGLVCLHAPAHKLMLVDDHILARVSPNPLIDLTATRDGEKTFPALVRYLASARRAHALELDAVLPGHGGAFTHHRPLLEGLFSFYQRRQERLARRLDQGPVTLYQLVLLLFPRADVRRMYLMLSEALGNIEVMEAEGRVRRDLEGGVWKFSTA